MNPLAPLTIWGLMCVTLGAFTTVYAVDERSPKVGLTAMYFAWVGMVMLYTAFTPDACSTFHTITVLLFPWAGLGIGYLSRFPYLAFMYWMQFTFSMIWTLRQVRRDERLV